MICPCKECVLVLLCRHKIYFKLFNDCSLLQDYIPKMTISNGSGAGNMKKIKKVHEILKPIDWEISIAGYVRVGVSSWTVVDEFSV